MRKFFLITCFTFSAITILGQEKKPFTPTVSVLAGGCVDNPFQLMAGVQKNLNSHFKISYDLHFWNTGYECYCDDTYTTGRFTSFTPSVKITYSTGKRQGSGLIGGIGLGYMFARDRGFEQTYTKDAATQTTELSKDRTPGNWDFSSIAPSATIGVSFRLFRYPVVLHNTYYFARTTEGWMPAAGGAGFTFGFRKIK
ncbi:MAG: hypothetical protein JNM88_04670 [Chitinophagaceae bacterium]|nr:hypothetical protein [Chitinophagaceae bacterium]